MKTSEKHSPKVIQRAVRLVFEAKENEMNVSPLSGGRTL